MNSRREFIQTLTALLSLHATGLTAAVVNPIRPLMGLQLRSTVKSEGVVVLSLMMVEIPPPGPDEVVVRIEAAPINPSDMYALFGPADPGTARVTGTGVNTVLTMDIPQERIAELAGRPDQSQTAGNEGAGIVISAGSAPTAQALLGRTVAMREGAMYSQYRLVRADRCLQLPEGTTPTEGASCFVNPLAVLGMVETMRREGHTALVHTAAASNLGQMLNRLCIKENIGLVNIVRRQAQVDLLHDFGADYVVNSSLPTFMEDLTDAIHVTGATLAFDAVGGGQLAHQILTAMERAALRTGNAASPYGTTTRKQVYIYGGLDRSPTYLTRGYGVAWNVGGWLMPDMLERIGKDAAQKMRERVASEIKTTFASTYIAEVSLTGVLQPEVISVYSRQSTGDKYLINPNKAL